MIIVGICLFRNEDRFLDTVIRNSYGFCDRFILVDNNSSDHSSNIARGWADRVRHIEYHQINDPARSHDFIQSYAGQDAWIFAVDGDEVYDPVGLQKLREKLLGGAYSENWQIFGKVLNVKEFFDDEKKAKGYLARPCRPMNKLYNFRIINDWEGPCTERLHYGKIHFKSGYQEMNKNQDQSLLDWDDAYFRCLHMVFVSRSSKYKEKIRPNIEQARGYSKGLKRLYFLLHQWFFRRSFEKKVGKEFYQRGNLVEMDVSDFFIS